MSIINKTIPGLYNGVSQQAPSLRLDNQCSAQKNLVSDIAFGLSVRNLTVSSTLSHWHPDAYLERFDHEDSSGQRQFAVMIDPEAAATADKLKVFENYEAGGWIERTVVADPDALAYLMAGITAGNLRYSKVTIADTTIIANRDVEVGVVKAAAGTIINCLPRVAMYNMTSSATGRNFTFYIDVTIPGGITKHLTYIYTGISDDTTACTVDAAFDLRNYLNGLTGVGGLLEGWTIDPPIIDITQFAPPMGGTNQIVIGTNGNQLYVFAVGPIVPDPLNLYRTYVSKFAVEDAYGNTSGKAIFLATGKFTNLPEKAVNGFRIKVTPEDLSSEGYYLVYMTTPARWVETVEPRYDVDTDGNVQGFDPDTMPVKLVRTGDTFALAQIDWNGRDVGDEDTNPTASFAGRTIDDVFFAKNRLGFLSRETAILSQAGDYYNFWVTTATDVLDADPIDILSGDKDTAIFRKAIVLRKQIFLLTGAAIYELAGSVNDGTMTPNNAHIDRVASMPLNPNLILIHQDRLFYIDDSVRDKIKLGVFEMRSDILDFGATDLTKHVPTYLEHSPTRLQMNPRDNTLLIFNSSNPSIVDTYREHILDDGSRVQAAFSKLEFCFNITGAITFNEQLIMPVLDPVSLNAVAIIQPFYTPHLFGGMYTIPEGQPYLDVVVAPQVNATSGKVINLTTWFINLFSGQTPHLLLLQGSFPTPAILKPPLELAITRIGDDYYANPLEVQMAIADGYSTVCLFGYSYEWEYEFSPQYLKLSNTTVGTIVGNTSLHNVDILVSNSGLFEAQVIVPGRTPIVYTSSNLRWGEVYESDNYQHLYSGVIRVPVHANSKTTRVKLRSSTWHSFRADSAVMNILAVFKGSIV